MGDGFLDNEPFSHFSFRGAIKEILITIIPVLLLTFLIYHFARIDDIPTFTVSGAVISGSFILYSLFMPRFLDELKSTHKQLYLEQDNRNEINDCKNGDRDREEVEEPSSNGTDDPVENGHNEEEDRQTSDGPEELIEDDDQKAEYVDTEQGEGANDGGNDGGNEDNNSHIATDLLHLHKSRSHILLRSTILTLLLLPSSILSRTSDVPNVNISEFLPYVSSGTKFGESISIAFIILLWANLGFLVMIEATDYFNRTRQAINFNQENINK